MKSDLVCIDSILLNIIKREAANTSITKPLPAYFEQGLYVASKLPKGLGLPYSPCNSRYNIP